MTHIYLLRHGQTDWNVEGRWQGHADIPLNARGQEQAASLAQSLAGAGLQAIYSSDLQRASQTACAVARATGLEIQLDARLREIHQGEWQGLLVSEIQARYQQAYWRRRADPAGYAPPGGETVVQVRDRLVSAVEEICQRHPSQRVAIVSHGFALAVVRVHYLGLPLQQAWEMIPENDEWLVMEIG